MSNQVYYYNGGGDEQLTPRKPIILADLDKEW